MWCSLCNHKRTTAFSMSCFKDGACTEELHSHCSRATLIANEEKLPTTDMQKNVIFTVKYRAIPFLRFIERCPHKSPRHRQICKDELPKSATNFGQENPVRKRSKSYSYKADNTFPSAKCMFVNVYKYTVNFSLKTVVWTLLRTIRGSQVWAETSNECHIFLLMQGSD